MASIVNINHVRKTDEDFNVTLQDSAKAALSIDRVSFTAKKLEGDSDANAVITLDSHDSGGIAQPTEIIITDGPNGKATIKLSKTATDIAPGTYFYDIQARILLGTQHTPMRGILEIQENYTDRDAGD